MFEFQRGVGSVVGGIISDYLEDQALILFMGLAFTLSMGCGIASWGIQQLFYYRKFQEHQKRNLG